MIAPSVRLELQHQDVGRFLFLSRVDMERTSFTIRATVQQIRAAACIHSFTYYLFSNVYHVQILLILVLVKRSGP
jgi:hypothetical protein